MASRKLDLVDLQDRTLLETHFPMWVEWGVEDTSVAVHSLGLSYLVTLGQSLGYAACAEYPVTDSVRADCVWWDKSTGKAVAAMEFERHKGGSELADKVRNLVIACHALDRPRLLGLFFWTKNFYGLPDEGLRDLWRLFQHGFTTKHGVAVQGADPAFLRVFECRHSVGAEQQVLLKGIVERRRT
jgi:hypothetical protein